MRQKRSITCAGHSDQAVKRSLIRDSAQAISSSRRADCPDPVRRHMMACGDRRGVAHTVVKVEPASPRFRGAEAGEVAGQKPLANLAEAVAGIRQLMQDSQRNCFGGTADSCSASPTLRRAGCPEQPTSAAWASAETQQD